MPSETSPQEQPSSRPSALTLVVASASSVVAAVVVSRIWGPGTIIGAAATPVIITLVGELLKKPAEKITVIRVTQSGTAVRERTAPAPPAGGELSERSVHRSRRRPIAVALATGLLAFVVGAVVLTSSELVFGDSSVATGAKRTTVFGGDTQERPPADRQAPGTGPTAPTETTTQTTTVPAPDAPVAPETGATTPPAKPPSSTVPPPTADPALPESGTTVP